MKKLIFMFITFLSIINVIAQPNIENKKIMKVSYIATNLSPNMISVLKSSISSPDIYQQTVNLLEKYKFYYSLYINLENNESAFVLDSIHTEPGVSSFGQINKIYTDNENNFIGQEEFLKSISSFQGKFSDLKWKSTTLEKRIGNYICTKLIEEEHNDIEIWVCTDIPINRGPGYFQSHLGLVLEASDFFNTIKLQGLSYIDSSDIIYKTKQELSNLKTISFKEELKLKDNAIQSMNVDKENN